MIIKKNLKSQMRSLKRHRLGNSDCAATVTSNSKKKKKENNYGHFPSNLLAASLDKESMRERGGEKRPPLVRTSRGRIQVLPSRFNDSVLGDWRKGGKSASELEEEFDFREPCGKGKNLPPHGYSDLTLSDLFEQSKGNEGVLKEKNKDDDFNAGDIVWAKARNKEPFWPAIVIDPVCQVPNLVFKSSIPEATCVMFLRRFGNQNQRVYFI